MTRPSLGIVLVARRLGIDHFLDPTNKRMPVRQQRFQKLGKRVRYMRRLSTRKTKYAKIMYSAGLPATLFGAEFSLLPLRLANKLRAQCARSAARSTSRRTGSTDICTR